MLGCSSGSVPGGGRFGIELIQEQAILDFYGSEEERSSALALLKSSCRSLRPNRGLSCYNLAILYLALDDIPSAQEYALRARTGDPRDPLYSELYFQISLRNKEANSAQLQEEESERLYRIAIEACKSKDLEKANASLKILVESGEITKETLSKGVFADCEIDKSLLKIAKVNSVKYSKEYYKSLEKKHPYQSVWDLSGEFGRKVEKPSNNKLTHAWEEVRKASKAKDLNSAKIHILSFKSGLEAISRESNSSKHLATNLRKAAYLLLSEDSHFASIKVLAKELSDTPTPQN
ncbi:hypothetical protein CH373_04590 [Leptospira perolatii]|uniref:Lipoprotein n=1 Tax=Leptospira perolatii TaxID=2023191 RepID=A0A2M9ZQZ9_9LEPT|nr:hypothetical protein CH360_18175 [Leptospira perolatii]PJZ74464.1 hypothetical protein CH373_04590 [Leptospira perolatii]